MPTYLIITNPVAGNGAGAARAEALQAALAAEATVDLVSTSGRGHATELAESRGADHDRVIAVGGDGTLNEVLTGVLRIGASADDRPALGFLPGGTANAATRAFGFATEPAELAAQLPSMAGRPVDVGMAEIDGALRPFLLWCGAGPDAVAIEALNATRTGRMGLFGLARKAPKVAGALARYDAPPIQVTVDGTAVGEAAGTILANVAPIAVGGTVHPQADPFDGRLDVVTASGAGALEALRLGAHMMGSGLTGAPGVEHRTATEVGLVSEGRVPVQIDGEPVGTLPLSVRLQAGAVRLLVP